MPEGFDPAIWKRFTAAVNASVGIKYNLDYERGIEVNARGLAETLDKVTKKLDIKDVTYDNLGEKAYDILKDENNFEDDVLKDLIKNNKAQFHQMCLSLPSLIGKDLFTTFKSKENDAQAQEDFKLVLYQSFQGFLEGVKACQVKFLDGKTRF
ncbi:hypothetical protein IJM86_05690 [bacterium]|nr:hypothetical protein [bacterium]